MKKFMAFLLAITMLQFPHAKAAEQNARFTDELVDKSKMFAYSQTVECETKNPIGDYAFSDSETYYVTYKLNNIAAFSVITLNYKAEENIRFILSDADNKNGTEIDSSKIEKTQLTKIGSFERYKYSYRDSEKKACYLTIEITQSKAKYIRIDSVDIIADIPLEITAIRHFNNENDELNENIFGASKTVLSFNQAVDSDNLPMLCIKCGDAVKKVQPELDSKGNVSYSYESLPLGIYEFSTDNFIGENGNTCDFSDVKGYEASIPIETNQYRGTDKVKLSVNVRDKNGQTFSVENAEFVSENEIVASVDDDIMSINSFGDAVITALFVIDGIEVTSQTKIHVPTAESISGIDEKINLKKGEELSPKLKLYMDNGEEISADGLNIDVHVSNTDVLEYAEGKFTALRNGTASVEFIINYYGREVSKIVSVGVGKQAPDILESVGLKIGNGNLIVGQQAYITAYGRFTDGRNANLFAANIKYFASNDCVTISGAGDLTALKSGNVSVYAEVTLGANTVKTSNIVINVYDNELKSAKLTVPKNTMCVTETMQIGSKEYLKDGKTPTADEVDTEYMSDSEIITINGDVLTANKPGTANIWVSATYKGKTVQSEKIQVTVYENGGFIYNNPINFDGKQYSPDWSGTYAHDTSAWWGVSSKKDNYPVELYTSKWDSYIIYEINGNAKEFTYTTKTYLSIKDAFTTYVAEKHTDGTPGEWTQIPQELISYSTEQVNGTYGYYHYDNTDGYLDNAAFIKICFPQKTAVDAAEGNENVKIPGAQRFIDIKIITDNAPKVCSVYFTDKNGMPGGKIEKALIKFDQDINPRNLKNSVTITEENSDNKVGFTGNYQNGEYEIAFDALDKDKEYILCIADIENLYGTPMEHTYTQQIPMPVQAVKSGVSVNENIVSATIISSLSEEIQADIICAVYDNYQKLVGIKLFAGQILNYGNNQINLDFGEYSGFTNGKIYVLKSVENLEQY